mmetsp:Transcript_10214/g.12929  ORF Transcript_10214/g.12929 Transcript_10214/m.12929 type:complete len:447 (+) Transcript_10214:68-1408(+)
MSVQIKLRHSITSTYVVVIKNTRLLSVLTIVACLVSFSQQWNLAKKYHLFNSDDIHESLLSEDSCNSTKLGQLPIIFLIGFQKAGTTPMRKIMRKLVKEGGCASRSNEPNFFSQVQFALERQPTCAEVSSEFLEPEFDHCIHRNSSSLAFLFTKSPCVVTQPWVAQALKSRLPHVKIAVAVRDPIERAFSGFIQDWDWTKWALLPMSLKKTNLAISSLKPSPDIFHTLVELQIAISTKCGIPYGTGDFDDDWPKVVRFNQCCRAVSEGNGHKDWPGCDAYGKRIIADDKDFPVSFNNSVNMSPNRELGWQVTPFGGYHFHFVREGVYIEHLRPWINVFGKDNIMVYTMNEVKRDESSFVKRFVNHAISSNEEQQKQGNTMITTFDDEKIIGYDEHLFKSFYETQYRKNIGFVPHQKTITMLKEFYQQPNQEFNEVFQMELLPVYSI